jgi:hypothetical protein
MLEGTVQQPSMISSLIADALSIKEHQSYGLCRVSKGRFN